MQRRRVVIVALAVAAVLLLSAPLWLGYFGPRTALYASTWRPWRSHIKIEVWHSPDRSDRMHAYFTTEYQDPWPGQGASPGWQTRFVTMKRVSPLLPWAVVTSGTGP